MQPEYLKPFAVHPDYWYTSFHILATWVCIGSLVYIKTSKWREEVEGAPRWKYGFDYLKGIVAFCPIILAVWIWEGSFTMTKPAQAIEQLTLIHQRTHEAIDNTPPHKLTRTQLLKLVERIHSVTEPWAYPPEPTHSDDLGY